MVSDPQVSPDGTRVAWVKTWMDPEHDRYRSQIQLMDLSTRKTRRFLNVAFDHTHPRWSPDGQYIAFLGRSDEANSSSGPDRAVTILGGAQLMVADATGESVQQLTGLVTGVGQPTWSPDGDRIAFTTWVDPVRGLEIAGSNPQKGENLYDVFNQDVLVVERTRYKADALGFVGNYRQQVAVTPFDPKAAGCDLSPSLLTLGDYDLTAPAWSPDGEQLVVAGNTRKDNEHQRCSYVYLIDPNVTEPQDPTEIFGLEEMRSSDLSWSPDGSEIVVAGHDDPELGHYGNQRLWLIDPEGRTGRCLTAHLDESFGDYSRNADLRGYGGDDSPRWFPDAKKMLVLINQSGSVHLHQISPKDASGETLTQGHQSIIGFSVDAKVTKAVVLMENDVEPGDLYLVDLKQSAPLMLERLTDVNRTLLDELCLTRPERFQVPSDDVMVDGWFIPPVNREPGKKYPLILYTGGGPGGMRASVFVHEFHLYAAHGYAVLHCNTRGNLGYGQDFSAAIRGAWGELDLKDNINCMRAAFERFDYIDPERLAVAGGSYGGFMATSIISEHPEFKAAVVDRCLFNRYSFNGTSDMGFLLDMVEFDKKHPWEAPMQYLKRSPLSHIADVKTPTLVIHSALDHRCPIGQGEQLFTTLRLLGVPTKLVRFPNENHDLSRGGRPWHRVFRLNHYLDWFGQWL